MSDFSMYMDVKTKRIGGGHALDGLYNLDSGLTLEDIVWDDFVGNDDHIVPGDEVHEKRDTSAVQSNSHKRLRCGGASDVSFADNKVVSKHVGRSKEGTISFNLKENQDTMLENAAWSHPSDRVFPTSDGQSSKKVSVSASDANRTPDHQLQSSNIELCADDPILGDQGESIGNSMYCYDVASTDNDISFFSNGQEDNEHSDLLCLWPEIENFEDVDRMFRNCDSSFGVGISNEDDFSWFQSSDVVESSDDAFNPDLKFLDPDTSALNNVTVFHEAVRSTDTGQLTNDADEKPTSIGWTKNSVVVASDDFPPVGQSSVANGSEISSVNENKPQVNLYESLSSLKKSSEREQKDLDLENQNSFVHLDNLKQIRQPRHSFKKSNHLSRSSSGTQKNPAKVAIHGNTSQSQFTFVSTNPGHPGQVSACSGASGVKSEANSHLSISQKESSCSSQIQSAESSHDISFQNPTVKLEEKKLELYHPNGYPGHPRDAGRIQRASYGPISVPNQASLMESEVEDQSELNCSGSAVRVELDSSNLQESSCMSSVLDEFSLEARSFRQLKHVMEKLDIRTKLCIRDSLYRLAQSAEQRHKCANLNSGKGNNKDETGVSASDGTTKCAGFLDAETDTNLIDRSVAHLLFHRPSDTSATPERRVMSVESHAKVHAPNNGHSDVVDNKPAGTLLV